jgi:hypothetical protein
VTPATDADAAPGDDRRNPNRTTMTRTPNHGYNVPKEGAQDWHEPLNENFERYDTDIEIRDEAATLDDYEAEAGAKFLATDTGVVYVGDGSDWLATFQEGRYTPPSDGEGAGSVAFGDPANEVSDNGAATVSGGENNKAGPGATVGGGVDNEATRRKTTVGGGEGNEAADKGATVGGGIDNRASGEGATVAGGQDNVAMGDFSFAAGRKAEAQRTGSFVWNNSGSRFVATDENQFLVNALGGVGIGTSSPDAPFHVRGSDDPALDGDFKVGSSNFRLTVDVETGGSDAGTARLRARGKDSDDIHKLVLGAGPHDVARVRATDDEQLGILPGEHDGVGLGWVGERWRSITVKSVHTEDVYENSDRRLKTSVSPIEDGLETVTALRPVSYEWVDDDGDGTQLGLIAQEVEEVVPEVVERQDSEDDDEEGYLAVQYTKLVPALIDAIQRQQEGIEERDERIEQLEADREQKDERIDDLEARLTALEAQVGADAGAALGAD